MSTRRGFFQTLLAGAVGTLGAVVVKGLPREEVKVRVPEKASPKAPQPALSLAMLQDAYNECWYGSNHARVIFLSPARCAEVKRNVNARYRFYAQKDGHKGLAFNDAVIVQNEKVPDDVIHVLYGLPGGPEHWATFSIWKMSQRYTTYGNAVRYTMGRQLA